MTIWMLIIIIQLFIINAITQQSEDQLQAQQKNVRENTWNNKQQIYTWKIIKRSEKVRYERKQLENL